MKVETCGDGVCEGAEGCSDCEADCGPCPEIAVPTPGSTLSSTTVAFSWVANGRDVSEWWLWVGPCNDAAYPGCGDDIQNSGSLGTSTTTTLSGLPSDGSPIWVRLWYKTGGVWDSVVSRYTCATSVPEIISPVPGSTFSNTTAAFSWVANGRDVSEWWLWVGPCNDATMGGCGDDIHNSGSLGITTTTTTVSGLPSDGGTIWARLWYMVGDDWHSVLAQYTSFLADTCGDGTCSGSEGCLSCAADCDLDGDGYGLGTSCEGSDCNDGDPAIHPGTEEVCNGEDDDCDDEIDEDFDLNTDPSNCGECGHVCALSRASLSRETALWTPARGPSPIATEKTQTAAR
ncbi:putative metal-binding motif-containing protein [Myxococcota bacterium]